MKKMMVTWMAIGLLLGMGWPSLGTEIEKPLIIDVRTEAEWNNGHVESAILIPYDEIGEKIGAIVGDKTKRIYLYCRSGRRSKIAQDALFKLGYRNVINLKTLENAAETMKLRIVK